VDTLYNLALAYDDDFLKDWQKAYDTCAEAIEVLETRVRAVSSPETRRAVAENQAKIYHRMVSLCIRLGKIEEALSYAERGKSRTLVERLHLAQLMPSDIEVQNKLEELRTVENLADFEAINSGSESRDFEGFSGRRTVFHSLPTIQTVPRENRHFRK